MFNGAVPEIAPDGGFALALLRALSVAALILAFGTLAFWTLVLPRVAETSALVRSRLLLLARAAMLGGVLLLVAWLSLQAAQMADAARLADMLAALPTVVTETRFGHVVALQAAALLLSVAVLGGGRGVARRRIATVIALGGLLLQSGHGHAMAMPEAPLWLEAVVLLHLAGAGFWLGGVPALAVVVATEPPQAGAAACRWFSPLGKISVGLVAGSALVQGAMLVGSVPGLVGTGYGWMALGKLVLFGLLFGFALVNRYRLGPALRGTPPWPARRRLLASLALQTAVGLAVVVAAAVLGGLAPGMHSQALWPFTVRPSPTAAQDPAVAGALGLIAAAVLLLLLAARLRRRGRWLAPAAALALIWLATPHLAPLIVPAYPTSFYRSPSGFTDDSIVAGAALYPSHCAACHAPGAFRAARLWAVRDGALFWWLSAGISGRGMPGFAATLSEDDRWALIDYIRAASAGSVAQAQGDWPVPAPDFQASCAGGATRALADLRGGFVRVVIGPAPAVAGVTTIVPAPANATAGLCVAADETLPRAYAIIAGVPAAALAGTQFLIDGAGLLREMRPPATAGRWNDPLLLKADIDRLAADHGTAGRAAMPGMAM